MKVNNPNRFLHERNANLEDSDKDGMTPIMVAAELGRADNLEYLVKTIKENQRLAKVDLDEKTAKKLGPAGVNLASRNSWCAAHNAAANGHLAVIKVLAKHGADLDKPLNAFYDKKTPMMLAAAMGHFDIVEFLFDHAKAAKKDR